MLRSVSLATLLALLISDHANAQQWAEKMFRAKKHDFGTVARGADVIYKFPIRNLYEEQIELVSVRSSCGCTTPSLENKLLKTGETGYVVAQFNTRAFNGSRSATLTATIAFNSNKGHKSFAEVQVRVFGTIRSDIVFHPGSAKFENVDQGEKLERRISVTYAGRKDWKITDVRSANEHLEVEMIPTGRQWGRVSYDLVIRLKETAPAGYLKDRIVLVTNDYNNTRIPLDIEGRIIPEISVSPQKLVLGEVPRDQSVTKKLVVRGKKPFKITGVECPEGGCFKFEADDESKVLHVVQVTFDACEVPEGKMKRAIHIATDRGKNIGAELIAYATVVKGEAPEPETGVNQPEPGEEPGEDQEAAVENTSIEMDVTGSSTTGSSTTGTPTTGKWKPQSELVSQ